MTTFSSERDLQRRVEDLVRRGEFADSIVDAADLKQLSADTGRWLEPIFSLDRISRQALIAAGAHVLERLGEPILLSADKDISLTQGERLRPDLVCHDRESESILIFELKVSGAVGRQAVSELAAYEQEVRNHLPTLADTELCHVLISSEWNTLMDHGVSAAVTWSGKRILCLEARLEPSPDGDRLTLRTRLPSAWSITGQAVLPERAFPTVTLCAYPRDSSPAPDDDRALAMLRSALRIVALDGQDGGGTGFAMLWRNHLPGATARYCITVCALAPFALAQSDASVPPAAGDADNLAQHFAALAADTHLRGHAPCLDLTQGAMRLLNRNFSPRREGLHTWQHHEARWAFDAEPLSIEFWGALGHHARNHFLSPAAQGPMHADLLCRGGDWTDPGVAIPLIDQLRGRTTFPGRRIDLDGVFRLGTLLGLDSVLRHLCQVDPDPASRARTRCRFQWNLFRLTAALREVSVLAAGARDLPAPSTVLVVSTVPEDALQGLAAYIAWLEDAFLLGRVLDVQVLRIGLRAAAAFDDEAAAPSLYSEAIGSPLDAHDTRALLAQATRGILLALTLDAAERPDVQDALTALLQALSLAPNFDLSALDSLSPAVLAGAWRTCLTAAGLVHLAVPHALHEPFIDGAFDWDAVRQGVAQQHAAGRTDVGVLIDPDGTIGLGPIGAVTRRTVLPAPLDEGILISSTSGGCVITEYHTWAELKAGSLGSRR